MSKELAVAAVAVLAVLLVRRRRRRALLRAAVVVAVTVVVVVSAAVCLQTHGSGRRRHVAVGGIDEPRVRVVVVVAWRWRGDSERCGGTTLLLLHARHVRHVDEIGGGVGRVHVGCVHAAVRQRIHLVLVRQRCRRGDIVATPPSHQVVVDDVGGRRRRLRR